MSVSASRSFSTARQVETIRPDPARRLEIPDATTEGLYLVVQPTGIKSWAVRYRFAGKPAKLTLGRFPAIKLDEARKAAREARRAASEGRNPAGERLAAEHLRHVPSYRPHDATGLEG